MHNTKYNTIVIHDNLHTGLYIRVGMQYINGFNSNNFCTNLPGSLGNIKLAVSPGPCAVKATTLN